MGKFTRIQTAGSTSRRFSAVVAVAVAAIILGGCASTVPVMTSGPTPTDTPVPPMTVTPTPTATADAALEAPNQVFGADCEAALPSAHIGDVLGQTVSTEDTTPNASVEFGRGLLQLDWRGRRRPSPDQHPASRRVAASRDEPHPVLRRHGRGLGRPRQLQL